MTPAPPEPNGDKSPISCARGCRNSPPYGRGRDRCAGLHDLPPPRIGRSCTRPIPSSASSARSSDVPRSSASSQTRRPSPAWPAPSCSSKTMIGTVQRARYMSLETIAPLSVIRSSCCRLCRQLEDPASSAGERDIAAALTPRHGTRSPGGPVSAHLIDPARPRAHAWHRTRHGPFPNCPASAGLFFCARGRA